jgi:hypothetical protein
MKFYVNRERKHVQGHIVVRTSMESALKARCAVIEW